MTTVKYPTMPHFVTEICTHAYISVTKWCIVGSSFNELWDSCNKSIGARIGFTCGFVSPIRKTLVELYSIAFYFVLYPVWCNIYIYIYAYLKTWSTGLNFLRATLHRLIQNGMHILPSSQNIRVRHFGQGKLRISLIWMRMVETPIHINWEWLPLMIYLQASVHYILLCSFILSYFRYTIEQITWAIYNIFYIT